MYVLAIWYRPEKRNFSQSVCILTLTAYSDTSDRTNLHNYTPFVIFTFHISFLLLTGRKKLKDTRKKGLFFKLLDEIKELKYRRRSPIYWKVRNKPTSCLFFVYAKKRHWLFFIWYCQNSKSVSVYKLRVVFVVIH